MNKLMMAAIGAVACSMVSGCLSQGTTKGGSYADVPDPKLDEYVMHWDNENDKVESTATVHCVLGLFYFGDKAPWLLRDKENRLFNLLRIYPLETRARNAALYKVCKDAQRDAILGAMYEVDTEDYLVYGKSTCTVRGWPARITGIENVSKKVK